MYATTNDFKTVSTGSAPGSVQNMVEWNGQLVAIGHSQSTQLFSVFNGTWDVVTKFSAPTFLQAFGSNQLLTFNGT